MLARELVALNEQYRNLVDAVSAGVMTLEEAVHTLDNLTATDGEGYVWRLDLEGRFLAGRPGETPQLSDPMRFAVPTPGPWDQPSFGTAIPSMPATPPQIPPSGAAFGYDTTPERTGAGTTGRRKRAARLDPAGVLARLGGPGRLRTPLVVVGAVVVALLIWNNGGPDGPSGTPLPVDAPSSTAPGAGTDVTTPVQRSVDELLALLGDPQNDPSAVVADPGDGDSLLLRRAQFAGYRSVGLQLVTTEVSEQTGGYRAAIVLRDADGRTIVEGTVDVLADGETLRLASWPELGR